MKLPTARIILLETLLTALLTLTAYGQLHRISEAAISRDGNKIAYVGVKSESDNGPDELLIIDARDANAVPASVKLAEGTVAGSQHDIAWSPDGKELVFLGSDTSVVSAMYIANVDEKSVNGTLHFDGQILHPRWSPDGKTIAFLFAQHAISATGPLAMASRDTGLIDETSIPQRIALFNLSAGELRLLSPADLHVYEFSWSPDGRSLAMIAAPPPGNNNWYTAELWRIEISDGKITRLLTPSMQVAVPEWSPNGSSIAFIGGLMSDEGIPAGDIFVLPASGGSPRNVTPGITLSPGWIQWGSNSREIQFVATDSGSVTIGKVDIESSKITRLWHGQEFLGADYGASVPTISLSHDGKRSAVIRESFENPPELWEGSLGKWRQVTRLNPSVHITWGRPVSVTWKSDSLTIQGWMVPPAKVDTTHLFPMVVRLHGGPTAAAWSSWPDSLSALLHDAGYFVLWPNYRGNLGCGESFIRANIREFGYGDFRDVLNGTEAMLKRFPIDSNRVGIMGWSYGGYLTMWAITQTQRYRAAVAGAGISNFQSYQGQNKISRWTTPFFGGTVYDIPEVYKRSSPIHFIKQAKTPTLILVGEGDKECPPPQSYEFWRGLKHVGVKTELYVFPNTGHLPSGRQYQERCQRTLKWFEENMR